jgi:hypothetical protein
MRVTIYHNRGSAADGYATGPRVYQPGQTLVPVFTCNALVDGSSRPDLMRAAEDIFEALNVLDPETLAGRQRDIAVWYRAEALRPPGVGDMIKISDTAFAYDTSGLRDVPVSVLPGQHWHPDDPGYHGRPGVTT